MYRFRCAHTHTHGQIREILTRWLARNGHLGGCRLIFLLFFFFSQNAFPIFSMKFSHKNRIQFEILIVRSDKRNWALSVLQKGRMFFFHHFDKHTLLEGNAWCVEYHRWFSAISISRMSKRILSTFSWINWTNCTKFINLWQLISHFNIYRFTFSSNYSFTGGKKLSWRKMDCVRFGIHRKRIERCERVKFLPTFQFFFYTFALILRKHARIHRECTRAHTNTRAMRGIVCEFQCVSSVYIVQPPSRHALMLVKEK